MLRKKVYYGPYHYIGTEATAREALALHALVKELAGGGGREISSQLKRGPDLQHTSDR